MLFTPTLLFLMPAVDPAFPRLTINQAIALGLLVEFAGYSSAAVGYWRQRRVAFEVAFKILLVTIPSALVLSWIGSLVPARLLFFLFALILFILIAVFLKFHRPEQACPC